MHLMLVLSAMKQSPQQTAGKNVEKKRPSIIFRSNRKPPWLKQIKAQLGRPEGLKPEPHDKGTPGLRSLARELHTKMVHWDVRVSKIDIQKENDVHEMADTESRAQHTPNSHPSTLPRGPIRVIASDGVLDPSQSEFTGGGSRPREGYRATAQVLRTLIPVGPGQPFTCRRHSLVR
ncbi:hypothetical protein C8R45DRAFT_1170464 [Mycena sanguinolenta]|nr:hypothetical protein C8R45DRAFT_1170464 [Mycena sanguinolenta]